jgi:hypothetical protein
LDSHFNINTKDEFGYSALHRSVSRNSVSMGKFLIENGIDVNMQDKDGKTALHYVAEYDQTDLVGELLGKGANLSIEDKWGNQPLWTAIFNDKGRNARVDLINLFLQYGADLNHKNKVDKSPLDIVKIANYKNLEKIVGLS